ncbi:MAG TPA: dehydrogenase [Phycisphaerales bacterium]|nr:dehydrogenase [Phycisphaerales bacterium]HCD32807.1 dehydrogenase [Phycisphaerales bacterium]|tara:strand:+ start:1224 stop:2420 length:1197 start_codon:yes stop_codon:yes gene_type:complete
MSTRSLNIALIGSSFMGRTHSNAYMKVAKFFDLPLEPVMHTIAARDAKKVAAFAKRWGWNHSTANWKDVCDNPEIDLIDIGTPNHVHKEMALAALEAGKDLACEKPLAGNLDDAREMLKAAKKYKKSKTFVWFTYRRCPAVAFAQQLVAQGKLGKIFHVRAAYLQDWAGPDAPLVWRFQGKIAGSGSHGDLGAHIIDMARFITGDEISEIAGAMEHTFIKERPIPESTGGEISGKNAKTSKTKMGKSTVDDAVMFLARFKGGALASFESTRLSTGDKNRNRIEIHGEKGAIRFDFERMNELEWYDATIDGSLQGWSTINVTSGADGHPYANAWWPTAHVVGYEHGFINMASDIINVIGGKQPVVPLPDFYDAYQTQRVLHAAVESARNRCPIKMSQIK